MKQYMNLYNAAGFVLILLLLPCVVFLLVPFLLACAVLFYFRILTALIDWSTSEAWFVGGTKRAVGRLPQQPTTRTATVPPRWEEFALRLIPVRSREHLIGDLNEEFHEVHQKYGLRAARSLYRWQVYTSLAAFFWEKLKWLAGLVLLWKSVQ
jgi:hypothetical protein